jgi:hypothetical protein
MRETEYWEAAVPLIAQSGSGSPGPLEYRFAWKGALFDQALAFRAMQEVSHLAATWLGLGVRLLRPSAERVAGITRFEAPRYAPVV